MNDNGSRSAQGGVALLTRLISSGRQVEARLDGVLAPAGLTFMKWRALDLLVREGAPVPLKLLPAELGCVKSNVTQLVDRLEADGAVRRLPDPDDRRGIRVDLTDAGRAAHRAGEDALDAATQTLSARSDRHRDTLRHALDLLTDTLPER